MEISAESIASALAAPTSAAFEGAVETAAIQVATVMFSMLESMSELSDGIAAPLSGISNQAPIFDAIWALGNGRLLGRPEPAV